MAGGALCCILPFSLLLIAYGMASMVNLELVWTFTKLVKDVEGDDDFERGPAWTRSARRAGWLTLVVGVVCLVAALSGSIG